MASLQNGIRVTRLAELVSAFPHKSQETLKQVQGDGFKKGDGLFVKMPLMASLHNNSAIVKTHNYASLQILSEL